MPSNFTLQTVIGTGWRCNPALGAFMRTRCGKGFRFNAPTRDFIHTEVGRSLAEAVSCYRASVAAGVPKRAIPEQLEYNRHTRDYYQKNPGATRDEVIASWWQKRSRPSAGAD